MPLFDVSLTTRAPNGRVHTQQIHGVNAADARAAEQHIRGKTDDGQTVQRVAAVPAVRWCTLGRIYKRAA